MEDNAAALKWCYNPVNHAKQKHIPVAYHFIREQVALFDNLNVVAVSTDLQYADLFTKCLPSPRMKFLVDSIRGLNPPLPTHLTRKSKSVKDSILQGAEQLQEQLFNLRDHMLSKQVPKDSANDDDSIFSRHFQEKKPEMIPEMQVHAATAA